MSAPHQYHQPNAPDDGDSDLEFDLEELDPLAASSNSATSPRRRSKEHRQPYHDLSARIPLRNLRVGKLRGLRRNGGDSSKNDVDEEDLRALIEDEDDTKRNSAGSLGTAGDDDAPLLPSPYGRRRPRRDESTLSKLGSTLRLPSFMSTTSRPTTPRDQAAEAEAEADTEHDPTSNRTVAVGQLQSTRFPANAVSNAKYTPWSFLPRTLYNEFSFFINMYFLLVALSQIIPALQIGYLSTYIAPLAFVISITLGKEALDDIARRRRDAEANSEGYTVLKFDDNNIENGVSPGNVANKKSKSRKGKWRGHQDAGRLTDIEDEEQALSTTTGMPTARLREIVKPSRDLKVGNVVKLVKDQRVPADMVLLKSYSSEVASVSPKAIEPSKSYDGHQALVHTEGRSSSTSREKVHNDLPAPEPCGEAFIRTDQLDGETDWKLRLTSTLTQSLDVGEYTRLRVVASKPDKKVNEFVGTVELLPKLQRQYDPHISQGEESEPATVQHASEPAKSAPLNIDNTIWANTVLASSSTVLAVVVYTGSQTRQALSTSPSRSKTGLLDYEINSLTKILCILTLTLSFVLVALEGFKTKDGRPWYISVMRFLILFSTIVPVGLRVNLDMGKSVYAWFIEHDKGIPGTVVRTSTIPEDLGRVEYLLSDKTGTLTQNGMIVSLYVKRR